MQKKDPNNPPHSSPAYEVSLVDASSGVRVVFESLLPSHFLADGEFRQALGISVRQILSHYLKLVCGPSFEAALASRSSCSPDADRSERLLLPVRVEILVTLPPDPPDPAC